MTHPAPTYTKRVLIMEDNKLLCRLYSKALRGAGFETIEAYTLADGKAALDSPDGVDVFLCDMVMGAQNSEALLKELRRTQPDLKIIGMSGQALYRSFAEELKLTVFLEKPIIIHDLLGIVLRLA